MIIETLMARLLDGRNVRVGNHKATVTGLTVGTDHSIDVELFFQDEVDRVRLDTVASIRAGGRRYRVGIIRFGVTFRDLHNGASLDLRFYLPEGVR